MVLLLCCFGLISMNGCKSSQPTNEPPQSNMEKVYNEEIAPIKLKELISRMKEELETDYDRFPELIGEVETLLAANPGVASQAMLHSMAAEMYHTYYMADRWKYDRRTAMTGYTPEDIREWSGNLFDEKIREHLSLSLQPAEALQHTPAHLYADIMEKGKDAPQYRPTLYDFLAQRAIELEPSEEIFREWLQFRRKENNPPAQIMVELDYLSYIYNQERTDATSKDYEEALDKLLKTYGDKDFSTEIRMAKVNLLASAPFRSENRDSLLQAQYDLLNETIALFPNYERIGLARNSLNDLTQPTLSSQIPQTVYPGGDIDLRIDYRNLDNLTLTVYKSQTKAIDLTAYQRDENTRKGELYQTIKFNLYNPAPYSMQDTILHFSLPETGMYDFVFSAKDEEISVKHIVSATRLVAVTRKNTSREHEVWVTDLRSGKPVSGATVTYYGDKRNALKEMGKLKTDKEGFAIIPANDKIYAFQATSTGDDASRFTMIYPGYMADRAETQQINLSLFTDRGIYRPGQNIFYKGIAWQLDKERANVVANKTYKVILRDANDKEVNTQNVRTNAYGSFHGEFTLPKQTLTGIFSIVIEGAGATWVRVEEYKRPTFQVKFSPLKEEVAFGDSITIHGNVESFSGVALQEGKVNWRIVRTPFGFYRGGVNMKQIAQGTTSLQTDGTFAVGFRPEKEANNDWFWRQFYTYELTASVTDSKGETIEASFGFPVGEAGIVLSINLPEKVDKKNIDLIVNAQLLNGEPTTAKGSLHVFALTEEKNKYGNTSYKEGKLVVSGLFKSGESMPQEVFANLPSGRYRFKVEAEDSKGRKVDAQQDIILYGTTDKRPPFTTHSWLIQSKTDCLPGETAEWVFGTSDKEAYVLYEVFHNQKRISREHIRLSNENRTFRLPFKESYGDGVVVSFTHLKEGELYVTQIPVKRTQPDRQLTIRPETFRDRLLPGSRETWKFRITDSDSLAVAAEVLAGMYDSSLDQILPFSWYFAPERYIDLSAPSFRLGGGQHNTYQNGSAKGNYITVNDWQFDRLDWQDVLRLSYGVRNYSIRGSSPRAKAEIAEDSDNMVFTMVEESAMGTSKELSDATTEKRVAEEEIESGQQPQLRTNFNETAFFFPALMTDEKGDLLISFTIPESNTSWKLQTIAHTKDLKYGWMKQDVITSKPFMVLPSLPRFLREGDRVTLSTQLLSQSDEAINGEVRLEWFDPATGQPLQEIKSEAHSFALKAKGQTKASWTVDVPAGRDLVGVRIIADANAGSDGEQHLLPILPSRILVTESTPFYFKGKGEHQIKLNKANSATPFRMTLEVSSNPVWYAVQALPTLTTPATDDILAWFASYYSNTLATSIVQAHPRISRIISLWTASGGTAATLLSNLEQNEELKNILLEETPWVMEAQNETERKQRLALLFDSNRADSQRQQAMQYLIDQQMENGAWGWYKGFVPNRYMTLSILKGMSALSQMGAVQYNEQEKRMQILALDYLDKSIAKDFELLKKHNKEWEKAVPSSDIIEFLYVRSSYRDIPEEGSAREAIRFYTAQAEKNWEKLSLYEKGEVALLMHRNGKKETAQKILAWLRKTATTSETQGMYWANNRRGSNFFTSPIDTHSLLMLLFHETGGSREETDNMKQWLLNQKRTQNWESTPATLNAIHAILLTGSDWLQEDNRVTVQWGTKTFDTSEGEAATGYLKETLEGASISQELTLHKEGEAPAWGAVYNQYFAPFDQITAQKGVLNVDKKLFIETNNGKERQIKPVENSRLRVGDKVIVRLTIRTDREMNYVYLKDLRAGCFEPVAQLSGARSRDGVWFYQSPKDVSENFFFERLPQGTFVIEYPAYVARTGEYAAGITTIQCLYAPEFVSHTEGDRVVSQGSAD